MQLIGKLDINNLILVYQSTVFIVRFRQEIITIAVFSSLPCLWKRFKTRPVSGTRLFDSFKLNSAHCMSK